MAIICTIDWETMGTDDKAPLLEMGWAIGSTAKGQVLEEGVILIQERTNELMGRVASFDTIQWWIEKATAYPPLEEYITSLLVLSKKENKLPMGTPDTRTQLQDFLTTIAQNEVTQLWCTDKNFDYSYLQQICKHFDFPIPLSYKEIFDCRHMRERSHSSYFQVHSGLIHSALGDAIALFQSLSRIDQDHGIL